ncbi:MAG: hypothetical protein EPN17_09465 [Methylobacter sp.]|nr:MAG: hypothetical protein EPN17_09465 [Methylobacter sp.]
MNNTTLVLKQKDLPYVYGAHNVYASSNDIISYAENLIHLLANSSGENIYQRATHSTFGQVEVKFPTKLGPVSIKITLPKPAVLSEWVTSVLQLTIEGNEDAALKEISLVTMRLKAKKEFSKLSDDLASFNLGRLPDIVLVALLRNTFSIRSQISCWNSLIVQTEQLLQKRGRDPRFLLRGLKSYS